MTLAGHEALSSRNDIAAGITRVREWLTLGLIKIMPGACPNLFEEAQRYRYDTDVRRSRSELPVDEYNHGMAGLRYLVMGLPRPKRAVEAKKGPTPEEQHAAYLEARGGTCGTGRGCGGPFRSRTRGPPAAIDDCYFHKLLRVYPNIAKSSVPRKWRTPRTPDTRGRGLAQHLRLRTVFEGAGAATRDCVTRMPSGVGCESVLSVTLRERGWISKCNKDLPGCASGSVPAWSFSASLSAA